MPEIIVRFEHLFAINPVAAPSPVQWIYPPDGYQEEPVPIVGFSMAGKPIRQGYPEFTFLWSFMKQEDMTALMNTYTPSAPEKIIYYIDKQDGVLKTMTGMMQEPIVGARNIVFYQNVAVKFGRCIT